MENKYHLSCYNIFSHIPEKNSIACINLLKRTYSELDPSDLLKLYDSQKINSNDSELKNFISQGIICDYNEKEYIKSKFILDYENKNNTVKITISPTLACNFNCPYCFEDHSDKNTMTLEMQDKVIHFIKNILIFSNKKHLRIFWFGGEPLLHPEIIEYISKSLISFCEENKILYSSTIITNGYYFNEKNVEILNKSKIKGVQITLDGAEKNHNLTRHLINGEGSFQQIINNLNSVKFNGTIHIRNNIHDGNKQDVEEIKRIINEVKEKSGNIINFNTAPIVNNPAHESNNQVNFLSISDMIKYELERHKKQIPFFKTTYCEVPSLFYICIDHNGNLYKCWEDLSFKERSYGNIEQWDIRRPIETSNNSKILMDYLNSPGIFDSECYDCIWLPICAGGCPSKRFFCNMKCLPYVPYKYNVDYFIQEIRNNIINESEK